MVEIIEKQLRDDLEENRRRGTQEELDDPLDILSKAVKVHEKGVDINEDVTLANYSAEFTKLAKFIVGQLEVISIIKSYLHSERTIVKYSNVWGVDWGKKIKYRNPQWRQYKEIKDLLMNRVQSMTIVSRSVKGAPLKAFLTYGRDVGNKELGLEERQGMISKLMGKKPPQEDRIE